MSWKKDITTARKELSLHKNGERFVFRYAPGREESVLDAFIDMANDRKSNFDWFDAAVLSFQLSKNLVAEADKLLCPASNAAATDSSGTGREDSGSQDMPWDSP